jgi:putative spermidine/putrescine transport system permease protein
VSGQGASFRLPRASFAALPVVFLVAFFLAPMVVLVAISFTSGFPLHSSFDLATYRDIFTRSYYVTFLVTTLVFAGATTLLCLLIGYPFAFYLVRYARGSYMILLVAVVAPLLVGVVIRSVGWMILLGAEGIINQALIAGGFTQRPLQLLYNVTAAIVGMVHVLLPFMVLSIASVLGNADRSLEEAASSLGASGANIFLRVTLPLSMPGVAVGCVLTFSLAIGAYATPMLLGGGRIRLLAPQIYEEINSAVDWSRASAMSMVLVLVVFALFMLLPLLRRRRA